jgi:hypothetical protein
MEGEEDYRPGVEPDARGQYVWPPREEVRLEDLVNDAFARADDIHEVVFNANVVDDIPDDDNSLEVNVDDMQEMIQESTQPVWNSCVVSRLQAGIILMNMCSLYGVP